MILITLFASALLILGISIYLFYGSKASDASPLQEEVAGGSGGCCGQHAVCEKESLLAAMQKDIEYYDDEELDRYRNTPADQYTDEQVEEFREVLSTMQEGDVPGWVRSLQLRGIELPEDLRDEVILIVGDLRSEGLNERKK